MHVLFLLDIFLYKGLDQASVVNWSATCPSEQIQMMSSLVEDIDTEELHRMADACALVHVSRALFDMYLSVPWPTLGTTL